MFRRELGADEGMLFLFRDTSEHVFWMKNTPLPLDLVFIDAAGVVVGVLERVEPMTTAIRTIGKRSRFVLEVNAGWAAAHGVAAGDRVTWVGFRP